MSNPTELKAQAGFISAYRGNSAEQQEAALAAAGVKVVYRAKGGEVPADAYARLRRPTDCLAIAGTLRVFGDTRKEIRSVTDDFAANGKIILNIFTGQRSDRDGIAMFDEAWGQIQGEARVSNPETHREHGANGAKVRAAGYRKRRLRKTAALKIWQDPTYTVEEALELIGWSRAAAYKYLKSRGVPSGPKPQAE
jgi:hypothetical protein